MILPFDPWDVPAPPFHYEPPPATPLEIPAAALIPPVVIGPSRTEVVTDETPRQRISAMPGFVNQVAVTEDGLAAVTTDGARAVRLWPALDGKREPVVLAMRHPAKIAIARGGGGLVIAGVDDIGQLDLVRTTAEGDPTRHVEVAMRPVVAIRTTSAGFVVLRDDRSVALIDLDGAIRGELVTEPGEYLASIAARRDAVLAIVETDEGVHGRWIDLATFTWGAATARLRIEPHDVIVSPNRERIAARHKKGMSFVAVRLSDGKIVSTIEDQNGNSRLVGFLDDRVFAYTSDDNSTWLSNGGQDSFAAGTGFQIVEGGIVGGLNSAIVIAKLDSKPSYVGYRMAGPTELRPTKTGFVATDARMLVELDARFRTRAGFDATKTSDDMYRVVFADNDHAIGFSYSKNRSLFLISTELSSTTVIASVVSDWGYESTTGLLYYWTAKGIKARRYDGKAGAFGAEVHVADAPRRIVLLDADQGREREIALIEDTRSFGPFTVTYGRIDGDSWVKTGEKTFTPSEEWWNTIGDPRELVRSQTVRVRAQSPDRSYIAEIRDQRLSLRDGSTVKWTVPANGVQGVTWTPRNELVIYGGGIAQVDLETGDLRDRQCGSWFGRWDTVPIAFGSPELCEVTQ